MPILMIPKYCIYKQQYQSMPPTDPSPQPPPSQPVDDTSFDCIEDILDLYMGYQQGRGHGVQVRRRQKGLDGDGDKVGKAGNQVEVTADENVGGGKCEQSEQKQSGALLQALDHDLSLTCGSDRLGTTLNQAFIQYDTTTNPHPDCSLLDSLLDTLLDPPQPAPSQIFCSCDDPECLLNSHIRCKLSWANDDKQYEEQFMQYELHKLRIGDGSVRVPTQVRKLMMGRQGQGDRQPRKYVLTVWEEQDEKAWLMEFLSRVGCGQQSRDQHDNSNEVKQGENQGSSGQIDATEAKQQ